MEKIRCPHCSAMNQDVKESDKCWQCGKPLGAKEVTSAAEPKQAVVQLGIEERVALRKAEKKNDSTAASFAMVAITLLILTIIVIFIMLGHW